MAGTEKCKTCNSLVTDKGVCCDLCDCWFHTHCIGIPDDCYKFMKNKGIFWFCESDRKKFKTASRKSKVDPELKQNLNEIKQQLEGISKKLDEKVTPTYAEALSLQLPPTTTNVTYIHSRATSSKGIVVKPIDSSKLSSADVECLVKQKVKLAQINVGVSKIRRVQSSGIFMATTSTDDCNKLEKEVKQVLGEEFNIFQPKPILPELAISNLSKEYNDDELMEELKCTNAGFCEDDKLKIVHKRKDQNNKWTLFLQADPTTFKKLANRYVSLDFNDHYIKENIRTLRCLNCQQYGHKGINCMSSPACARCAGNHKTTDCQRKVSYRCINCVDSNKHKATKFDTNHSCGGKFCKVHLNAVESAKLKIDYTSPVSW